MTPKINIVYSHHKGPPALHYDGPEGTVHMWNKRDPNKINVFTKMFKDPQGKDCFIHQEPVVVFKGDFNRESLSRFYKVFTWFDGFVLDNFVTMNYQSHLEMPSRVDLLKNRSWKERSKEIVIIANPKHSEHPASLYDLRTVLADGLHERGLKVSWYGQSKVNKPYYKGSLSNKIRALQGIQFTICSENTYDEHFSRGYLTEKLPHAVFAGAVPIYMGCHNVDEFFMEGLPGIDLRKFVNLKDFSDVDFDGLIGAINSYSEEDYNIYRAQMVKEHDGAAIERRGFFYDTSHAKGYRSMLRSLVEY